MSKYSKQPKLIGASGKLGLSNLSGKGVELQSSIGERIVATKQAKLKVTSGGTQKTIVEPLVGLSLGSIYVREDSGGGGGTYSAYKSYEGAMNETGTELIEDIALTFTGSKLIFDGSIEGSIAENFIPTPGIIVDYTVSSVDEEDVPALAKVAGANPVDQQDYVTKQYFETNKAAEITAFHSINYSGGALSMETGTETSLNVGDYGIITNTTDPLKLGSLVRINIIASLVDADIIPPSDGRRVAVATEIAPSGGFAHDGEDSFKADTLYMYDEDFEGSPPDPKWLPIGGFPGNNLTIQNSGESREITFVVKESPGSSGQDLQEIPIPSGYNIFVEEIRVNVVDVCELPSNTSFQLTGSDDVAQMISTPSIDLTVLGTTVVDCFYHLQQGSYLAANLTYTTLTVGTGVVVITVKTRRVDIS